MNKSESIANLSKSLAQFQGEIQNPKNTAKNPQFNSKYAPLNDILAVVRPVLSKFGLSVMQTTHGDLENINITTILLHESGEWIETEPLVFKGEQSTKGGGKVLTVQGAGSMITYGRRYQLSAILGISSEDDDDGNHASEKPKLHEVPPPPPQQEQPPVPPQDSNLISQPQQKRLFALAKGNAELVKEVLGRHNYTKSSEITRSEYEGIAKEIETEAAWKE